jgi:hypothetical protein
VSVALAVEKQIKTWNWIRKVELIEADNPGWRDLSSEWGLPGRFLSQAQDRLFVSDSGRRRFEHPAGGQRDGGSRRD